MSILKYFRRQSAEDTIVRNSNIYCLDIDISLPVCYANPYYEAQPPLPSLLYSKETLVQLKKLFPIKIWDDNTTVEDLAYSAGQQSIITFIEQRLAKEQRKAILR